MVCPNCGAQINEDSRFCRFCGTPMAQEDAAQVPDPAQDTQPVPAAPAPASQAEGTEAPAQEEADCGGSVAFTYENGYRLDVPETASASTATGQAEPWNVTEQPHAHKKKKILLTVVAAVLVMALAAGVTLAVLTFTDTGSLLGLFSSGEDRLAQKLERTWYLGSAGTATVLLEFKDGSGICQQQYQLFGYEGSQTLAEFTYEITGSDTVRISYGGKVQDFQVEFSDNGRQMTLSPHLLVQGTEIWLAYD